MLTASLIQVGHAAVFAIVPLIYSSQFIASPAMNHCVL